jgi:hypothetical protein
VHLFDDDSKRVWHAEIGGEHGDEVNVGDVPDGKYLLVVTPNRCGSETSTH